MERILNIKVDLECPEEAKFAIDEAVKAYEESKRHWTAEEIANAKRLAMGIMRDLCLKGTSMNWIVSDDFAGVYVWNGAETATYGSCYLSGSLWNLWVAKCAALCQAIGRDVPKFITDKAGESL